MVRKSSFILLSITLLFSCTVLPPATQEPIPFQDRYTLAMDEGRYLKALEILVQNEGIDSLGLWEPLNRILASLQEAQTERNLFWRSSLSLEKLGLLKVDLAPAQEIGNSLLKEKRWAALLSFLQSQGQSFGLDFSYWRERLKQENFFDRIPVEDFLSSRPLSQEQPLEGLLDATVTVFVDKGIQIEQGISRPDTVVGSGFFIDQEGYLITNYHVIQSEVDPEYKGFSRAYIRRRGSGGNRIPVKVIGWDPELDLALVKAPVDKNPYFPLSYWNGLSLGDKVKALGSPLGLESTITSGVVSNRERILTTLGIRYQVDVPVNPGNSGGPLVNEKGEVVGVIFAGIQPFQGLNFAIPVDYLHHILPRLYDGGLVQHNQLGVQILKNNQGLKVNYVAPFSPAQGAGIQVGDYLTAIDGQKLKNVEEAQELILRNSWGALMEVQWERDSQMITQWILPQKRELKPWEEYFDRDDFGLLVGPLLGMRVERIGNPNNMDFRVREIFVGSLADQFNFTINDPFKILSWKKSEEHPFVLVTMNVRQQYSGFLDSRITIPLPLNAPGFL